MDTRLSGFLPFLAGALMLLGLAGAGRAQTVEVQRGTPLARVLSDTSVVKALHRLAAREGIRITRINQRMIQPGVVLTFHGRPQEGGAEAPRLTVEVVNRVVRLVEAPGLAAAK